MSYCMNCYEDVEPWDSIYRKKEKMIVCAKCDLILSNVD